MPRDYAQFQFTLLSQEFFEDLDSYQPSDEYFDVVRQAVGTEWQIRRGGFWTRCVPRGACLGRQGWKIHVSAIPQMGLETLQRVVPLLASSGTPFKFCSDARMLRLSTGKNWPRTASGKFVTIYPASDQQFLHLLESLYQATVSLKGPRVLTDRPYRDSSVVHYRYGGHAGWRRLNPAGERIRFLVGPDGARVPDGGTPFFSPPSWTSDPCGTVAAVNASSSTADEVVIRNRYRVTGALRYSNNGGIYDAVDTATNSRVIVREARPFTSVQADGSDARAALAKEARILQKLGPLGCAPTFVDLFEEAGHVFLVQEKIEADSLWITALKTWARAFSPTVLPSPASLFESLSGTIREILRALDAVHRRQIVLRDLTKTNVLMVGGRRPVFVDCEIAYELDRSERHVAGWTPGYASPQQMRNETPRYEDDYYALGALILDLLSFNASAVPLNRTGALNTLDIAIRDMGLPASIRHIIEGLLEPDLAHRWTPDRVLEALEHVPSLPRVRHVEFTADAPPPRPAPSLAERNEIEHTISGIRRYIETTADFGRTDRLWPSSPEAFTTNPVSIQFGGAGIAEFLRRSVGHVPVSVVDWIRSALKQHRCPPGLYNGRAGIAMLLFDLGLIEEAEQLLDTSKDRELLLEDPGLYYGAAGWGLANLWLWARTGSERFLFAARDIGHHLLSTARQDGHGVFWRYDGKVAFGLGHGQSGIALFLTYLHAASSNRAALTAAKQALQFELAHAQERENLLLWYQHGDVNSGPLLPYTRFGTAGFGAAALRYSLVSGDDQFLRVAQRCAHAAATRNSSKLWQDFGLAGLGELLIDFYQLTGDENYLNNAFHTASGIVPSRINRPGGFAFAGYDHLRISCDIGMGSAGIGIFLHRLLNPSAPRLLFPDDLLATKRRTQEERPRTALAVA